MKLSGLTTLVGIVLILSITACQAKPTPESTSEVIQGNATNTESVDTPGVTFKTLVAGTLTAIAQTMEATDYLTPTETATITLTPLPTVPPPPTRTPIVVIFTMTGDTYCRKGPGAFYPSITILTKGTVAEIIGRDAYNSFVYLQTTDYSCWVSIAYDTVTGNLEMLPVYTPQPTAVPTRTFTPPATSIFSAVFSGLTACGSDTALNFTITNTGRIRLESIQVISRIKGDDKKYIHQSDNFTYWSAGSVYQTSLELLPGESAIVSTCRSGAIPYDPTGMKVNSSVTVCSANGLSGSCNTLELEFSPR
jgi:archaellum component FlaF (FlaF/FlaG flagellin family)